MTARPVRKAVFPVAGMGTRFLPATKAVPKEMLPVVDKPVIQYAVEEAREAGIEQFVFVTGRGKHVIEDHFDHAYELESLLRARDKTAELNSLLEGLPETRLGRLHPPAEAAGPGPCGVVRPPFRRQRALRGAAARRSDGRHARRLVADDGGLSTRSAAASSWRRKKSRAETKRYGVVDPGAIKGNATEVKGVVEKPDPAKAPSKLCVIGRYILQPEIFAELDRQERGAGNEIQLTDSMAQLIGRMPFHAVKTDCARYRLRRQGGLPARQYRGRSDAARHRAGAARDSEKRENLRIAPCTSR